MVRFKAGAIVNIASIYGIVGNDFSVYENTDLTSPVAYSAIKGGLINMNRYLASYYGKENIRFNCVSPGGIFDTSTPSICRKLQEESAHEKNGKTGRHCPIK